MTSKNRKTHDEMAAEAESVKDTPAELEGLVPVNARVAENLSSVFSVRFGAGELGLVIRAAESRGMKAGAFIRAVALAAAQSDLEPADDKTLMRQEAAEHVRALGDLVSRL